jgi:hypothetical protein
MSLRLPSWASIVAMLGLSRSAEPLILRKGAAHEADRLIGCRGVRATRYAKRSGVSQQKRRRLARQVKPQGWKGGAA